MDTGKLLKIIRDIKEDEQKFDFQSKLVNINRFFGENNPDALNNEKKEIEEWLPNSNVNQYVISEVKALSELGISEFFGGKGYEQLNNILNRQAHEVKVSLDEYINKRSEVLSRLDAVKGSLEYLGFKSRQVDEDECEIGFSLPHNYATLDQTEKVLGDIKHYLSSISVIAKENNQFKIRSVNNGCIEFNLESGFKILKLILLGIEYLVDAYEAGKMAAEIQNAILNFSKKRSKNIKKMFDEEKEERMNKIIDRYIEELGATTEEQKSNARMHFLIMLKHYEEGLSTEVRLPKMIEPSKPEDENAEAMEKYKKDQEKFALYNKAIEDNKDFYRLQAGNFNNVDTKFLEVENVEES